MGHYTVRLEVLKGPFYLASATAGFDITGVPVTAAISAVTGWDLIILIGLLGTAASYFLGRGSRAIRGCLSRK